MGVGRLLLRDLDELGIGHTLFLLLPLPLGGALLLASRWAVAALVAAAAVPVAWLSVYWFDLSREHGDNQMLAVALDAVAMVAWASALVTGAFAVRTRRRKMRTAAQTSG